MTRPLAEVEVPASSAALGSGFAAFAAALSLRLRADLYPAREAGIEVVAHGEGTTAGADGEENLVARAFREGLRAASGTGGPGGWRIEVSSMIPAARGLGSSAAAIVAGLLLGMAVGRRRGLPPEEVLRLAAVLDGQPEAVTAAFHGGITLVVADADGALVVRRFRAPEDWIPVVFVPHAESPPEMRTALPPTVSHADAAVHGARAALLATAILTGDTTLLRTAMDDRIHQPYRLRRLRDSAALIDLAYERGAAGATLSGAGPSVLAICDGAAVAHGVEKAFAQSGVRGAAMRLRFDTAGARVNVAELEEAER